MTTKKKLKLNVLFDTSVIKNLSANFLLRKEIVELFDNHHSLSDIDIVWNIPDIVVNERKFQMNKQGRALLPSIQKLEKLFGHNLNIDSDIIRHRIDDTIKEQINKHSLHIVKADISRINWETIINNAINRIPPFEDSDKEKGFRDALILESLKQLIEDSPKTKSVCRIVFITNDSLLNNAASQIASTMTNVNVFNNISEFESLVNILNSQITEDLINTIKSDASNLFFEEDVKTSLFYADNLRHKISKTYSNELNNIQEGADKRENGTWWINNPGFEKKEKQKVYWKTIVDVDFENFKVENETSTDLITMPSIGIGKVLPLPRRLGEYQYPFLPLPKIITKEEKINEGKTRFEVIWSVTLTTNKKLINPKIESIKYIDTINK